MTKENGKPQIRFAKFKDTWEQRKFSEGVSEIGDGLHGTPIYCEDGNVYFINGNNLVDGKIVISAEAKKVNESQQSTADKSLDDTTILMSINGTIGNLAYYSGERLMLGKSAAYIKVSEFDKRFVYAYLQAPSVQGYFMDSLTGTTIKNLGLKAIREMIMFIPQDVDEQKRIGKFLDYLDNLITLHQRKYDKLTKAKKSMLEKMFPKNGTNVPEVRFKGFTDAWEQRKLIDYLEVSSEKNRDNRFTKEDVLSVSGEYGIVNQIEFQGRSFAGASVSNYGVVENGDVVYTKSPLKSNPYGIIKTNKGIPGIVSTLYAVYKPKEITDSKFVQIYFELDSRMNSYMHPLVNKGAKNDMKVSAENALKGMVSFPKKDEQEMISLYFSTLDHIITLHQRKLEKLKILKKACLEKMFV